jgi:CheY-like chemotaxis protein
MPASRTTIVSVGADPELVSLRNHVLREAGFNVISAMYAHDALARIESGDCGVLLMCYSLPMDVRRKLAEALRHFCPGSPSIVITNEQMNKPKFADTFVYGVEGPEALIEVVTAAVEKSRSAEA